MAKYRELSSSELETFEKEFVDYLVVNGITANEWVRLKKEEKEKAETIVSLFSDVVFEGVLRKIKFLDVRTKNYVQSIQCLDGKMIMVALSAKDSAVDLTTINFDNIDTSLMESFELHKGEKTYIDTREKELFELTEKGYAITDGKLFKRLILATV